MILALLSGLVFAQDVDGFVELRLQGYAGVDADVPLLAVERFRPTFEAPLSDRVVLSTTIEAGLSQGWTAQGAVLDIAEREDVSPVFIEALERNPGRFLTPAPLSAPAQPAVVVNLDRPMNEIVDHRLHFGGWGR